MNSDLSYPPPMKPSIEQHSSSSTHSPAPSTPVASCPPPHSDATARQGPCTTPPQPPPTGTTGQTPPSTVTATEPPIPQQDGTNSSSNRSLASGKHPGPASPTQ
ncbi:hypothetical protein GOODEAATRI_027651 [Goodea atripinnis]|uniref:Uncharacterized protein n=1 Tax=Goodea atripinnis TaxID=208336 RepID=A0ABV0MLA1_9TELE